MQLLQTFQDKITNERKSPNFLYNILKCKKSHFSLRILFDVSCVEIDNQNIKARVISKSATDNKGLQCSSYENPSRDLSLFSFPLMAIGSIPSRTDVKFRTPQENRGNKRQVFGKSRSTLASISTPPPSVIT